MICTCAAPETMFPKIHATDCPLSKPLPGSDRPAVGAAALLIDRYAKDGVSVLLGLRKGSFGAGTWGCPGGHVEHGETVVQAATRELREETGIVDVRLWPTGYSQGIVEGRHYLTMYAYAHTPSFAEVARAQILEPEKCAEWRWVPWTQAAHDPEFPTFGPLRSFLLSYGPLSLPQMRAMPWSMQAMPLVTP